METIFLVYFHDVKSNENVVVMSFRNELDANKYMNERNKNNTNDLQFYYTVKMNLF